MCDRFFPDEPEYDIEILEWIVEEDYTVEWEYVWGVKLKEPVFLLVLGGYIERLSLAFIYQRVLTKYGYDCLKRTGKDHGPVPIPTHILIDCPEDDDICVGEAPEAKQQSLISRMFQRWRKVHR